MTMSESHLIDLYETQWSLECRIEDLKATALGRNVSLWSLISDNHGQYSDEAAVRFADAMARKCVAVRRIKNICRIKGMTWRELAEWKDGMALEDESSGLPAPELSDEDIEGKSWQYEDGSQETDDGTAAMLVDLFYCAVRIAAQNPDCPLDHDEQSVFFDFAYMPRATKQHIPAKKHPTSQLITSDEENRTPDVDPTVDEREDPAGQWLERVLDRHEFDVDEFDDPVCSADDASMRMAQYYALLCGCDVTYVPGNVRALGESWDFDPYSYDMSQQHRCESYRRWRDGFINPDEFCARYERFRDSWQELGLPEDLDMDVRRAFDLTLVELGISPLDDNRLNKVNALLSEVKEQLNALVGDTARNVAYENDATRLREDGR